jgi:hypothetical protein
MALTLVVNWANVAPTRPVVLSAERLPLETLIAEVFKGTDFTCEVAGRYLLVVPTKPLARVDDGQGAIGAIWREDLIDETVWMETITFRTGRSSPELWFMDNRKVFELLDGQLRDTAVLARLTHISVTAAATPDGKTEANERLAVARAQNTKGYLGRRYPHIAPEKVQTFSVGEEWSGLRRLVLEDEGRTPDREQVLALLENADDEAIREGLQELSDGRTWRYIADNHLPRLRGATAVTLHFWTPEMERRIDTLSVPKPVEVVDRGEVQRVEIARVVPAEPEPSPPVVFVILHPEPRFRPVLALKTNFAAYALGGVNLEVEVPLGQRWSLAGEALWSWRGFSGATLEGRHWWRGSRPRVMTGWFAGVYAGGGVYDLVWRGGGPYAGDFFHAGISGGYAHTINRSRSLGLEYSLGLGWLHSPQRDMFLPTRAKVSLVWMLQSGR